MSLRRWMPELALGLLIAVYVAVFGTLTWNQQRNYGTFGFDMGIYDQGVWLLANGELPFVTVRGLHLFGHHVNPILFLLVPVYWLGGHAGHLFLIETIVLASAAVPVFLLARQSAAGRGWVGCAVAAVYLLNPTVEWINWWHFHPDALAIPPLLWAWWFARCGRWRWFAAAVALALSTKEDVGLAVMMVGVVLVLQSLRRRDAPPQPKRALRLAGTITATAGLAYFLVATQVVIPHYLGGDPFYAQQFFPEYGDDLPSVVVGMITSPDEVLSTLRRPDRIAYFAKLLAPVGGFPATSPATMLIAAPQLAVNALSSLGGTHDFRFHYSSVVVAAMMLATTESLRRFYAWPRIGHAVVAALVGCAAFANLTLSPSPLGRDYDSGIWAQRTPRHDVFDRALAAIPDDAAISASYSLVPHVTHRVHAYEWPNPWKPTYYGLDGENAPDPKIVDYLVLDTTLGQESALVALLVGPAGDFEVVVDEASLLVARRRR